MPRSFGASSSCGAASSDSWSRRTTRRAPRAVNADLWPGGGSRVSAVTAVRIDGRALAEKVRVQVAEDVRAYGGPVCLATILVGDDPASHTYVGSKHKASHEAGIDSRDHRFPSDTAEATVLALIDELNADDAVDGILVQLPLPDHMDEPKVLRAVDPGKDVDGFHVLNAGRLYLGEPFLVPATPSGVMEMLEEHGVDLQGKEAVVIGRSEIVGKPMAMLLLARHATVTICHSRTVDLAAHTRRADVLDHVLVPVAPRWQMFRR